MIEYDDTAFVLQRIAAVEIRIVAYETAILALIGGAVTYSFDDGQTRQSVTRNAVPQLEDALSKLINMRGNLIAQLKSGVVYGRPGF